jgi:hypothetical protein
MCRRDVDAYHASGWFYFARQPTQRFAGATPSVENMHPRLQFQAPDERANLRLSKGVEAAQLGRVVSIRMIAQQAGRAARAARDLHDLRHGRRYLTGGAVFQFVLQ